MGHCQVLTGHFRLSIDGEAFFLAEGLAPLNLGSTVTRPVDHIHEVARQIALGRVLERDIEVGRDAEHVHQRPQGKAAAGVGFEAEIDAHAFGARGERLGVDRRKVGGAEIAGQLVVEIHGALWSESGPRG